MQILQPNDSLLGSKHFQLRGSQDIVVVIRLPVGHSCNENTKNSILWHNEFSYLIEGI
jgi:hypothetical protein